MQHAVLADDGFALGTAFTLQVGCLPAAKPALPEACLLLPRPPSLAWLVACVFCSWPAQVAAAYMHNGLSITHAYQLAAVGRRPLHARCYEAAAPRLYSASLQRSAVDRCQLCLLRTGIGAIAAAATLGICAAAWVLSSCWHARCCGRMMPLMRCIGSGG